MRHDGASVNNGKMATGRKGRKEVRLKYENQVRLSKHLNRLLQYVERRKEKRWPFLLSLPGQVWEYPNEASDAEVSKTLFRIWQYYTQK